MKLAFLHPSGSDWFEADVDPAITGDETLQGLREAGFLPEPKDGDYNLVLERTGKEVAKTTPFESLGVRAEDKFAVVYRTRGAIGLFS